MDDESTVFRIVVVESPYRGGDARCVAYARACVADCLTRGEAPFASHLLYTQPGILNDASPVQRSLGMCAGWAFHWRADAVVVYTDIGESEGVTRGISHAEKACVPIEYRTLEAWRPRGRGGSSKTDEVAR
jgi:hypothetical protein